MAKIVHHTLTIADGATDSDAVRCDGLVPVGVYLPSGWTTADLSWKACATQAGTYVAVQDPDGAQVKVTSAVASKYYALDPTRFLGVQFLKAVAGSAQAGGDSLTLALLQG